MLGKGKATAITDADMAALARELGCHPADLEAIAEVESNGFGWFPDGRIKILFEKHKFYAYLPEAKRPAGVKLGVARKTWLSPRQGGYKDQPDADARYRMLEKAAALDENAAFMSISVGRFQIMGFNHGTCGFKTAREMFDAFCDSEVNQLRAFAAFLKAKSLVAAIRRRDFQKVETIYNGGGQSGDYAEKMSDASNRLRKGKWANWDPSAPAPKPTTPAEPETPASEAPESLWASILAFLKLLLSLLPKRKS